MKRVTLLRILLPPMLGLAASVLAQVTTNQPVRVLPGELKVGPAAPPAAEPEPVPAPSFSGITRPMVLPPSPTLELTNGVLAFDHEVAEALVTDGAAEVRFGFGFTNISAVPLAITNVAVSCGCTAVELPPLPWVLPPGGRGNLPVTLEVAGKSGVVTKSLQVRTDRGVKTILVRADVRPPVEPD